MRNASRGTRQRAPEGSGVEAAMRNACEEPPRIELVCARCQRTITTAIEGALLQSTRRQPAALLQPVVPSGGLETQAGRGSRSSAAPVGRRALTSAAPRSPRLPGGGHCRGRRSAKARHRGPVSETAKRALPVAEAVGLASRKEVVAAHKSLHN